MNKNFLTRIISFVLAAMMILTSLPINTFAEPVANGNQTDIKFEIKYDNGSIVRKEDYINETKNLPVVPKKTENAKKFVANPDMPKLYTVHSDFKVQRGDDLVVSFQPYIATAGDDEYEYTDQNGDKQKVLSYTEKSRIKKHITFPKLDGYTSATPNGGADITYDFIKNRAKKHELVGAEFKGHYDYIYTPITSKVKVKHLFQGINDFNKYDKKLGEENKDYKITTQHGVTGTSLTIQPLPYNEIIGYVPESTNITTQVPENPDNFEIELRYNLAHYTINYDTAGGTEIPARTLYYGQVIPKIADESIPTKVGGVFQGWKPSVDLKTKGGKTFEANKIIAVGTDSAIKDLDANLIMPASKVTFTAVWKDKEKADYAVQFWAEKADHADGAPVADKYDYIGTRVYKDQDTGSRPDLDNVSVKDIVFPDLDQARLNKIWANANFNRGHDLYLNKFFVYNKDLTRKLNADPANGNLVKSVDSTGKTVYNIYYDRQVYDLYFTKSNDQPDKNTIYPEIWGYDKAKGEAVMKGGPGNPYHYKARFNEMMYKWPNDAKQTKGFTLGYQSFGWGPNYTTPNWPTHLDTPPYRLNAGEFLDMDNYTSWGGYTKHIDKGDGTTIDLEPIDFTTLSFGIKQDHPSIPHHMDFWMDGFKDGETIIRYDLVRTKADTGSKTYGHKYPIVTGFTPYGYNPRAAWPVIIEEQQENGRVTEDDIGNLNDEREEITPNNCGSYYNNNGIKLPIGQLNFIPVFFSDADEWGDAIEGGQAFTENGYLRFKYTRNKYPLRFNYDPSIIRDDSYFNDTNQLETFYEFPLKALSPDADTEESYNTENPKNILDNPEKLQELGLTDLVFNDANDGNKLKVKRPEGLSDQMVFKGWALDPAGTKLIWQNKGETMPFHPLNLYAKWGEPDYKWKVTFDPDGGVLGNIKEENLTQERKTIQEGDIGQIEENTYAKKEANDGDKQVFTVIQRQKLVEPKFEPTRKGYDFMGWEVIHYKKDAKTGDYTNEQDTSYRDTYKVPELYSFGNDVVSPIYLKAIWVKSDVVDIESHHHFLDNNYKEVKQDIQPLRDRRVGSYLAAVGSRQNADRILVPKDEWDKLEENNETKLTNSMTYKEYKALDKDHPRVNSYSQQIRIEPEKIQDPDNPTKLIPNPDAKLNQFHFYYRPFRQREYKVNYLDERGREEVEEFIEKSKKVFADIKNNANLDYAQKDTEYKKLLEANRKAFKAISDKYAIIDQEAVKNGKRHFDARNYRPIAGWVLDDKPQQQLFFDIDEDTSVFYGINETGFDEINFFYKDVRVVEVKKDDPVPKDYVRVTFKAADGGSFTDKDGKAVKELYYDVVKGLRSQLLPVPQELKAGEEKADDKYYITPDDGKNFIKWDEQQLLNDNTIIEKDYTFTAQYDWSDLKASSKGLVRTESYEDPNGKWTNKFAPTIEDLKKQLVLTKNNNTISDIDNYIVAQFFDDKGNELKTDEDVLNLLKEQGLKDMNELVSTVNIKAKVKFKDQKYKELEKEKEGLGDEIAKLKAQVAENNKKITELNKAITDKEGEKKKLDSADPDYEAKIAAFDREIADMRTEINNLKTKNIADEAAIPTIQQKIADKTNAINTLKGELSTLKTEEAATQAKIASKEAELKPLEKQLRELNEKISVDSAELNKLKAEGKLKADEITKKEADIQKLENEASDIEKKITVIKNALNTLKTEEADKQEAITKKEADISSKEKEIWNKAQAIKDYEAGLKEQELDIPVTIYKNVYEALTNGDMPKVLKDATAPGGDLEKVTGDYVKVTVQPTNKPSNKDAKIYYVNPKAWVEIKEVDISADAPNLGFTKWTADKAKQNEDGKANGEFDFSKRHMFTEDTVITPNFSDDVKEQIGPDKPDVPGNFVKVIVDKTANAELGVDEKQTQTFWVNPTKEVTIPVAKPNGKTIAPAAGAQAKAWIFKDWTSAEATSRTWTDTIKAQFTEDVTTITANYKEAENIIKYDPEEPEKRPDGYVRVKFEADEGLTLSNVKYYYVKKNSGVKLSDLTHPTVDAKTGYEFNKWNKEDTTEIGDADITVTAQANKLKNVIEDDGKPGTKPAGYVDVVFVIKDGDEAKGSLIGVAKFFVKPNEYVMINPPTPAPKTGFEFGAWDNDATIPTEYKDPVTTITASFNELDAVSTVPKPGYVKVEFTIEGNNGSIETGQTSIYYVDPNRAVTLNPPTTKANIGYVFEKWDQDTTTAKPYTTPTTVKGTFKKLDDIIPSKDNTVDPNAKPEGYVTVTFTKGDHGSSISGETVYYVNPTANKTLADITPKPTVIPDTGYAVKGWDKEDDFKITQDTTVNAKYDDFDNVIPKYQDDGTTENTKPAGYIEVTFDPTNKAKDSTQKIVYVRPNTAVILKGYEPKVEAKDNYEFSDWNVDLTKKTEYENGTIITALYNDKGDIKTSKEPGYVKVEFKTDDRGKLVNNQGILVDTTELWIAPNKEITIPDPSVIPNAGHTFTVWDKPLTVTLTKNQEPYIINAQYSDDKNIILKTKEDDSEKPKGYVTVTFRADDHGSLEGDKKVITYFVNPDANIMIVDTVTKPDEEIAVPMTKPDANYANDKWYESIDKTNPIKTDLEYVARFNKGKVTLTYNVGEGTGTVPETITVDYGTKVRLAPATGLTKADAKFIGWKIGEKTYQVGEEVPLTEKITTATAQWTKDAQIIEYDPVKDPTTRPDDSYVRVTFEADNGLGLTNQKAYYVKKNAKDADGNPITLGNAKLAKPDVKTQTGYKFDKWDLADTTIIADKDILVTAKATKLDPVIPEKDSNNQANTKPEGYKEVTFVIKTGDGSKGSLEGVTKFYVNPNEYVTINNPPKANANTGFEFGAWSPDPSIPTVYKEDKTIEASFNGLKDVIPKTKPNDSEKPKGYVTVTFETEGKGGSVAPKETTVYFVKPNTTVTVPQPKTIAETGYKFNNWNASTKDVSFDKDKTIKGSFTKLKDIIPAEENGTTNAKPDGYITVTFEKGEHGSLTGQTVYYVNPKADPAKTIGQITKPTVKAEVGYKFTGWDKADTEPISENLDIVVKAQYTALPDVIVKTADDDSQKPDGYIAVTFDTTNKGRIKYTSMITKKVLFVNPNKAIVLKDNKAPGVVPKTGYEFSRWDVSIDKAIQYENGTTITALYNEPGDISTKEVYGYVKVEFKPGTSGSLSGTTEYWIKPGVQVNLPEPTVDPNVGYKFDKWDKSLTVKTNSGDPTYEITATYEELPDLIPQVNKDGSDKPKGYVKVTFKGEHGTLVEPTIYYVNPNKEIWLLQDGFTNTMVKNENAYIGYTSVGGKWDVDTRVTIIEDKTITYTFKKLDDVIEKTSDNQVPPKGYVKVTLNPKDKATDETKTEKIYFVNPLKKVTLPEFKPIGKEETINDIKYTYEFKAWTSIRGVLGAWPNGKIEGKFTQNTDIEAKYTKKIDLKTVLPAPVAKENVSTPIGVTPDAKDLIKNVYDSKNPTNKDNLPEGTTFDYDTKPIVNQAGDTTAKVKVIYPNGKTVIVEVPIKVVDSVIPQIGNEKPKNVPSTFVKVTFDPTANGTLEGTKIFWVDPTKEVIIPVNKAVGKGYNVFAGWKIGDESYKPDEKHQFKTETTVTASYTDSDNIIPFDPKAESPMARPEGYYKVTFDAQVGLKLRESKAYYVKKDAKDSEGKQLTLKAIKDAGYPAYDSANGYQFSKWDKADTTVIGTEDIVVTALAKQVSSPVKPGDEPGYRPSYPEIIYRDRIVEKEKIVEKVVEKTHNIYGEMDKEFRYMQGFNGKFRPYDGLTRAEAAQILANALKADGYGYDANYALSYNDVGDMWYTDAIRVVTQANVFQGYSDGTFKPQSKITRAEWVATLRRFQSLKEANGNAMMLKSGHWAIAEVEAAYEAGWLGVYQEGIAKFDADKPITRQEVAYVSNRAFRRVLDKIYLRRSAHTLITYKDVNPSMPLYEDILCASNTLLTDGKYYRANTVDNDVNKFNMVTDGIKIDGKKFQFIIGR